ncbi:hypothetical protein EDC36_104218 [Tepidimonas ignava]|uniref:Uncharacterized protein n=1 Tax=Tepidimonas ignava TaxID=114249 RepID=A0A4R3LJT7_9BURK|nr:hypothetical protein [Tepidimonas ignava]TCS98794.1 hypothetical protein EDC36_104218 [Tepidimonas ignava]TSE20281.1 hypothetical protein Tigna_01912 [Tepidimonas ignava]
MSIPSYAYSTEHLEAADGGERYIAHTGAYTGTIDYARAIQSSKGAWGVELGFVADDGRKPKYPLTLWTLSADGKRYFGHDLLDALLVCAGVESGLKPGKVRYWRWDRELGEEVEAVADGYPALKHKRIGLLLQRELYTTQTGKEGSRLNIVGVFDPQTRQTASEKAAGLEPQKLAARLASLKDKDSRAAQAPAAQPAQGSGFEDMQDDVPF